MTRRSSRTQVEARVRLDQVLLTSALALVLTTLPVTIDASGPALDWQSVLARGGGGGGGNGSGGAGNGQGGGHGGGRGDHGKDASEQAAPIAVPAAAAMPTGTAGAMAGPPTARRAIMI
jgi:hypothetical protein